ncbi:MFS transporter small subunit, partial [Polaromonas sp. UBA4122]|uniref:MFS transporter small subunit n=1 Tax=Polaromonas sp. UBA4122 TaxID=1947074 RepID=UPI0025D48902
LNAKWYELQRGGGGGDAVNPGMAVLAWLAVGIPLAWGFTARCTAKRRKILQLTDYFLKPVRSCGKHCTTAAKPA